MNISLTSTFSPMTFEEFMAPIEKYKEAYEKEQAKYENLIEMTETWKDVANKENNPESYALYKSYADQLNSAAVDFSQGMTPLNRGNFLNLKRDYYRNIEPIRKADEARKEYVKYIEETMSKDPSAFFKEGTDVNVDKFLNGKTISKEYDTGTNTMNRVSTKVQRLASSILSNPEFTKVMDNYAWQIKQGGGLTPEYLMSIIDNNIDNSSFSDELRGQLHQIRNIYDEEMNEVKDWTPEARRKKEGFVKTGMYAGLAAPTYQFMDNKGEMSAAEEDRSALQWAQFNFQKAQAARSGSGGGGGRYSATTEDPYNNGEFDDYADGIIAVTPDSIESTANGKKVLFGPKSRITYQPDAGNDLNFKNTQVRPWSSIGPNAQEYLKQAVPGLENTIRGGGTVKIGIKPDGTYIIKQDRKKGKSKKK